MTLILTYQCDLCHTPYLLPLAVSNSVFLQDNEAGGRKLVYENICGQCHQVIKKIIKELEKD